MLILVEMDRDRVFLNLSPELLRQNNDVFMRPALLRMAFPEAPESQVLNEPEAGARDHDRLGVLVLAGKVER